LLKWDGHTHTQFCYHGNPAKLEQYIERAIELGFQRYSVTEHSPIPLKWIKDEALFAEIAMPEEELSHYFEYAQAVKNKYSEQIEIAIGLELDYLHDRTDYTAHLLDKWGHCIEDVVYSVHYLPGENGMYCVDFTVEDLKTNLLSYYGTMEKLVDVYFDHVELAIVEASKLKQRSRIGHLQLIRKFEQQLPPMNEEQITTRLQKLLPLLKQTGVGVDVNIAGYRVATCEKAYVPEWFIQQCKKLGIECVYGSDAHKPEQLGLYWDWFEEQMSK